MAQTNAPPLFPSPIVQNLNPTPLMQPAPPPFQNNNNRIPLDTNGKPPLFNISEPKNFDARLLSQSPIVQNLNPTPLMQPAPPPVQNNNNNNRIPLDTNGKPQLFNISEPKNFDARLLSQSQYMPPAGQPALQQPAIQQYGQPALQSYLPHGLSQGLSQGLPQGLSQGLSQGLPQGLPQGLSQGLSQGLPHGLSQGLSHGLSHGLSQGLSQGLPHGLSQGLSQGLQQGLPQVGNSVGQKIINSLPEGLLSPDTKTQVGLIASNPIGNIAQIPSVFTKLTKDVEKKLLVTVLERFKTILELFKQPASDAVNALLKKELDALTENMNDPSLRPIVDKLSRAAEIPINRFLDNLTDILQRYFPALVGKLFNTAGNVIGEIPVVGVFVNAALAFSNVLNTVTTASNVFDKTTKQMESLQNELSNALDTLVNDTHAHVDHALDPTSIMKKNASGMSGFNHRGVGFKGGSASRGGRKMHTLKRIHTSIQQFIHTNKRTLKRSYKKLRRH